VIYEYERRIDWFIKISNLFRNSCFSSCIYLIAFNEIFCLLKQIFICSHTLHIIIFISIVSITRSLIFLLFIGLIVILCTFYCENIYSLILIIFHDKSFPINHRRLLTFSNFLNTRLFVNIYIRIIWLFKIHFLLKISLLLFDKDLFIFVFNILIYFIFHLII
jgi:hypothetical protein